MSKFSLSRRSFFKSAPFAAAGVVAATKVGAVEAILRDPIERAAYHYHEMSKALAEQGALHGASDWTIDSGYTSIKENKMYSRGIQVRFSGKEVETVAGELRSYHKDLAEYIVGLDGKHEMRWGNASLLKR